MRRLLIVLALALSALAAPASAAPPKRFAIEGGHFLRDGKPYVIRAGEMHYPRIPREYWRSRLRMAKAMGLNTIQTYVFWNLHEPEPGKFDFSGNLDIAEFVREAGEEGLDVVLRPGPYVCAEWDFGGYPAWLLRTPGLRVRSMDPRFMQATASFLKRLGQELAPLQVTHGGPILMVQVENEYGSFGDDHDYMAAARQQLIDAGFDAPLYTADGGTRRMFEGGSVAGVFPMINGFDGAKNFEAAFARARSRYPDAAPMVAEYYPGWFDHWGEKHHTTKPDEHNADIDWMLAHGVSFSFYMFHGGTSFGWMQGANYGGTEPYQPDTTSYDYDAPLDEAGRPTPKYFALREVIAKHLAKGEALPDVPKLAPTIAIPRFELTESVALRDALPMLSRPQRSEYPQTMERLGQNYGFTFYRTKLPKDFSGKLTLTEARDYVIVLVDGVRVGKLDRRLGERSLPLAAKAGATLDLLVENMGRINYNQKLVTESKGIVGDVALEGCDCELTGWEQWTLPLEDLSGLEFRKGAAASAQPVFRRGSLALGKAGDTFLDTRELGKGQVWVNGHNLGRYWNIGPQQSLFLPGAWLKKGRNEVVVLEVEPGTGGTLQGVRDPIYDTPGAGQ